MTDFESHPPAGSADRRRGAEWLQPASEPLPLERYVRVLRERIWVVILCVVVCFTATAIYVSTAAKVYEAEADLLVSPAPRDSDSLVGLPIVRESSDPTRDVETVARLVTSSSVARRVRDNIDSDRSTAALLHSVEAEPVAQSNIVAITAQGETGEEAQVLANAFGNAIVEDRTQQLHDQLDQVLQRLRSRREEADDQGRAAQEALELQINELETLRGGPDPTIRLQNPAELPTSQVAPRPVFSLAASIVIGVVLGLVGVFALELLDPRVRREEQLRRLLRLPVLARIPREAGSKTPLRPERLAPATIEAYRTLRATAVGHARRQARLALAAGHEPVGLRRQDDDGDQPRRLAGAGRQARDPRRGRPAAPLDRAHARPRGPAGRDGRGARRGDARGRAAPGGGLRPELRGPAGQGPRRAARRTPTACSCRRRRR